MATKGYRENNLMKIRDAGSADSFKAFVHYFLQHTIPKINWMSGRSVMKVSELFTPVDEAFAVLLMINHWMEWEHLAKGNSVDRQNKLTLYTQCYKEKEESDGASSAVVGCSRSSAITIDSQEHSSVSSTGVSLGSGSCSITKTKGKRRPPKVKGWSKEGLKKFTDLCKHIHKIRTKASQQGMEEIVKLHYAELDAEGTGNARKRKRGEIEETLDEAPFSMYQVPV